MRIAVLALAVTATLAIMVPSRAGPLIGGTAALPLGATHLGNRDDVACWSKGRDGRRHLDRCSESLRQGWNRQTRTLKRKWRNWLKPRQGRRT